MMLRIVVAISSIGLALASCSHPYVPGAAEIGAIPMDEPVDHRSRPETDAVVSTTAPVSHPAPDTQPLPEVAAAPTLPAEPPAPRTPRFDVEFAGEEYRVSIDGQRVAKEHLRRTDDAIEIISTSGQVLQSIPIPQPKDHPAVMIGVRFEPPGKALTKHIDGDMANSALVVAVLPGSPGFLAGIEDFDLVTAVDGDAHASPAAVRARLGKMAAGDSITLTIRRGETTRDVAIKAVPWKHVPVPAQLQPMPIARVASPVLQPAPGTPNAPLDTNARGRPAAAAQRSAAGAP